MPNVSKVTRAEFIGLGGIFAGAAVGCGPSAESDAQVPAARSATEPDLVVVNARVYTIDAAQPRAEAFAIKDARFVAIGSSSDIQNLVNRRTQVIDAERMIVTPGLIDTHCHPSGVNELYEVNANVPTVKELQQALLKKAAGTPPGYWVTAFMFDDTKLDIPLHRKHLDEAVPNHPVAVNHRGGHTSWYNSKALELAGITRQTRDPDHGRFFRDEGGELNGRVAELARTVFSKVGKREEFTPEDSRERGKNGMMHISELLTAAGLTTVHDASAGQARVLAYRGRSACRRSAASRLHDARPAGRRRHEGGGGLHRIRQ